jgi:hypothetical protein
VFECVYLDIGTATSHGSSNEITCLQGSNKITDSHPHTLSFEPSNQIPNQESYCCPQQRPDERTDEITDARSHKPTNETSNESSIQESNDRTNQSPDECTNKIPNSHTN